MTDALMDGMRPTVPLWFCTPCTYMALYGDDIRSSEDNEPEPLSTLGDDIVTVTPGLFVSDHADDCTDADRESGNCECDKITHSTRSCAACGNHLHGERHAFIGWLSNAE